MIYAAGSEKPMSSKKRRRWAIRSQRIALRWRRGELAESEVCAPHPIPGAALSHYVRAAGAGNRLKIHVQLREQLFSNARRKIWDAVVNTHAHARLNELDRRVLADQAVALPLVLTAIAVGIQLFIGDL